MLKKGISLLIVTMLLLMAFTGCVKKPGEVPKPQPPTPVAKTDLILATTTSTQDSGLLDVLVPAFEQKMGYKVKTVAVGSGQALAMGEKGEADVLLVHAPDSEKKVVASGAAINRRLVMHNDFVIIGPSSNPAQIKGKDAHAALVAIAKTQSPFISRGDKSGTDQLEKKLWSTVETKPAAPWYQESGTGMGQTLAMANEKKAYTITDRATYLAQKKNLDLNILVEGDPTLLNIYHVMEVNPEKYEKVNKEGAKAFSDFLISPEGQTIIANFGKDKYGQSLFFADAGKKEEDFGL